MAAMRCLPAFCLLPLLTLSSCGADTSPSGVVRAFAAAGASGDVAAIKQCVVQGERAMVSATGTPKALVIKGETIDGDTAVVEAESEGSTAEFVLVRENDAWRISLTKTALRMVGGAIPNLGVPGGVMESLKSGEAGNAMNKVMEEAMKRLPGK